MNSRILKKLCKRASQMLIELGNDSRHFGCDADQNWQSFTKFERKSLKKYTGGRCQSSIKPLKNTIGIAWPVEESDSAWSESNSGWVDYPAYEILLLYVECRFGWIAKFNPLWKLSNPSIVFELAQQLIADKKEPEDLNTFEDDPDLPF